MSLLTLETRATLLLVVIFANVQRDVLNNISQVSTYTLVLRVSEGLKALAPLEQINIGLVLLSYIIAIWIP